MIEWLVALGIVGLVLTVLELAGIEVLEWTSTKLGLSGSRRLVAQGLSRSLATVRTPFTLGPGQDFATGTVEFRGELWDARCSISEASALNDSRDCKVLDASGLVLLVGSHSDDAV